jgi:carbon-monoxide dehydrogenase catalytic subunit
VYTVFGVSFPTTGSEVLTNYLFGEIERELGGMWDFAVEPMEMAEKMVAHIDKKRKALGIDKSRERVLYDMAMRRELEAM